jgi:hypothetical protein
VLISLLSLKYDHNLWMRHFKIGAFGLLAVGAAFNISLQNDHSFFLEMRRKYFLNLKDEEIVNFDEQAQAKI